MSSSDSDPSVFLTQCLAFLTFFIDLMDEDAAEHSWILSRMAWGREVREICSW